MPDGTVDFSAAAYDTHRVLLTWTRMEYQQILVVPLECLFYRLSDNHAAHQHNLPCSTRSTNKLEGE